MQFKNACAKVHCRGERPERHWLIQGEYLQGVFCLAEVKLFHICFTLQVFLKDATGPISPFHDIPYKASDSTFHVVIEIPRWVVVNIKCWIGRVPGSNFVIPVFCQMDKCQNGSGHQGSPPPHSAGDQHDSCLREAVMNISFAGYKERETAVCCQLFPSPWLHLELWGHSSGSYPLQNKARYPIF